MLHPTFILFLLASTAGAQLSESNLTFEIVSLGATIDPVTTTAPVATPTSAPVDDDQPAPYESVFIPASETFNPSEAPAFTESIDPPLASIAPVYSSTPCSSEVQPTEAPEAPPAATFSEAFSTIAPVETPPAATYSEAFSTIAPVETLPAATYSEAFSTIAPVETPSPGVETPCTEGGPEATETPLDATLPVGTGIPSQLPPFPTGTGRPPYPFGTGRPGRHPSGRPGFGWGRPRPSGMWPSYPGYPRPTGIFGRPRPTASFSPEKFDLGMGKGEGKAIRTPCTLETRVRPTATARAVVR